ncbi:MAG TPA: TMEM175 family protein [Solirubrobacterales bacterium]|nr:TMEM175 family protein [Solirubrobacterales bacterium]
MSTNRMEAFSDGVFAIAITLLVLEIHVPEPGAGENLGHELLAQWPSYAAFVVSFLTIGIIWINHHAMVRRLRVADHSILIWNLLLLMTVSALPFTTALMAAYLKEGQGESLAAAVYSGSFLLMSLVFSGMNRHILFERVDFLEDDLDESIRRLTLRRGVVGLIPYAIATAMAVITPYLTLAICAAIAVFYASPAASAPDVPTAGAR